MSRSLTTTQVLAGTLVLIGLGVASFSFAQTAGDTGGTTDPTQPYNDVLNYYQNSIPTPDQIKAQSTAGSVQLTTDPEAPGPNQTVTANVVSYLADLDTARITWSLGGKVQASGIGQKSFTFTTGGFGSNTTVAVSGTTADGIFFSKTLSFHPLDVDLSWQADTYTPPFYRGKALPTAQSGVRVVARLLGAANDPSALLYQWRKDGVVLGSNSGYGKTILDLPRAFSGSNATNISVTVMARDGSTIATKYITLRAVDPIVLFYENRPLEGIRYNAALGADTTAGGNEFAVRVEPYFVSKTDKASGRVLYRFSVDGNPLLTQDSASAQGSTVFGEYGPNQVTIVNNGSAQQQVALGFEIQDAGSIIASGEHFLNLLLGGKNSGTSF